MVELATVLGFGLMAVITSMLAVLSIYLVFSLLYWVATGVVNRLSRRLVNIYGLEQARKALRDVE